MKKNDRPTVGLALSGGGNRSCFYIGFLEVLDEHRIPIDYITAMSGSSLVAAAYACGTLQEFKDRMLDLDSSELKELVSKSRHGGMYSMEKIERELKVKFTKQLTFEEVRPLMSFVTVDIEAGEVVDLCMGDIARAVCASCTLPGVFEPIQWGKRTLVDGGILSLVPFSSLEKFSPDITIGVDMRGTKNIFSSNLINLKRFINFLEKSLFIDRIESFVEVLWDRESENGDPKKRGMFSVLGRSLDVVIEALKNQQVDDRTCDMLIVPDVPKAKRSEFTAEISRFSYNEGRRVGLQYVGKIKELIIDKTKIREEKYELESSFK